MLATTAEILVKPSVQICSWRQPMIRKLVLIVALGSAIALAGCNTVKGLGRDIESVGKAGEKAI